ncbi:MAG: AGE family epimerase/isomerase [Muribaculaceae bacterium]|nr:AGE family epimerase/isomerase [Muribaculaceae bacterium]MDE6794481.1 AGE family epimerase/isomerase [Muribaculaceae bacterium]
MDKTDISLFRQELLDNLTDNILPYWIEKMTDPRGGYYGRRDGFDNLLPDAPKGAILHARILWTFSAAYNATGNVAYLYAARQALDYILANFIDEVYGGAYWSVTSEGEPLDTKKQFYAIAFIIYGLAEYYIATGDEEILDLAYSLFESIEEHARDYDKDGYIEATTREWQPIEDMRLSERDANASKTMNTHLHILEGYTNLLRALKKSASLDPANSETEQRRKKVEEATANLLRIFLHRIENPETHHLTLFFNDDWQKFDDAESYGHDIEASWLLLESAEVLADEALYAETLAHTEAIAQAALKGREKDGSMVYELHTNGHLDADRHWWVQAENVIGQLYLARFHSDPDTPEEQKWLADAYQSWRYIADNLIDPNGEWYWSRRADGTINRDDDKAGFWKCPYHNSRMCLESTRILDKLSKRASLISK